jgi:RHS repeat-associated protein
VLRTELYGLDGSPLEELPYTVTEASYTVTEVEPPPAGETRRLIFFPHVAAERTTQWERGDDPLTSFALTSDYDAFGQPRRRLQIACPRGWRQISDAPGEAYLATLAVTEFAAPDDPGAAYIHDRAARVTTSELVNTQNRTLADLEAQADADHDLVIFAQSLSYYDCDPAAPALGAFQGLPLGRVGPYGALVRSEMLALTDAVVARAYGANPPAFLDPTASNPAYPAAFVAAIRAPRAGYVYRTGSYFVTGASRRFDFHTAGGVGRGLVRAQRDPVGAQTQVDYDQPYQLLPATVTEATGMITLADYDYRVLRPKTVTDPNLNETRFTYTASGLLQETWVRGKPTRVEGDRAVPSVRMDYGLRAFFDSMRNDPTRPEPAYVRTIRRVWHDTDPAKTDETIETREYSDGFGRLLQTRTQGEAERFGDPLLGGGNTVLAASYDDARAPVSGRANTDLANPNVIVSGWQTYDNKGQVVEKYEPFFAIGWDYDPPTDAALAQCRKVTMQYDPRGHAVRTTNPDGSQQRVIFGVPPDLAQPDVYAPTPWDSTVYDVNDNAGRTHPAQSADYSTHWNTPTTTHIDALGRVVDTIERPAPDIEHRTHTVYDIQGNVCAVTDPLHRVAFRYAHDLAKRALRTESLDGGLRTAAYDATGAALEQHDAKGALVLHAYDALGRPSALWASDGAGEPMGRREAYVYGDDPSLALTADERRDGNLLGRLTEQRDDAGIVAFASYDFKGSALSRSLQPVSDTALLSVYANPGPNGEITPFRIDWDAPPPAAFLDGALETRFAYDALRRIVSATAPATTSSAAQIIRPTYNKAGALEGVDVEDTGSGARQTFVARIVYNAKGQRVLAAYGNGVMTRYAYDADTFRLARLRSEAFSSPDATTFVPTSGVLQELGYAYDFVGNILAITDRTPGCGVANNPDGASPQFDAATRASLSAGDALVRRFVYDPLYRLVSASGRESKSLANGRAIPESNDWFGYGSGQLGTANQDNAPSMTALYLERYAYDASGNMTTLSHASGGNSWTRWFGMDGYRPQDWAALWPIKRDAATEWTSPPSNRLTNFGLADDAGASHAYDPNGNLVSETSARHFEWDYANRMRVFRVQPPGAPFSIHAQYRYDAAGRRVKKLVRSASGGWESTLYVDGLVEVQRVSDASGLVETAELQVMDNHGRIAVARLGPALPGDGAAAHPVKFHLGDHLGSSGVVISADGSWINREEYFPYGECSLGSYQRKRYRFTGKERDEESGLNYHGARYFAQWMARWISADPLPTDTNLFKGLKCNPVRHIDPDGRKAAIVETVAADSPATTAAEQSWDYGKTISESVEMAEKLGARAPAAALGHLAITAAIVSEIFYRSYQNNPMARAFEQQAEQLERARHLYQNGMLSYEDYLRVRSGGQLLGVDTSGQGDVTGKTAEEPKERAGGLPEWLQKIINGNNYNRARLFDYPYREVYVVNPGGGYYRLDAYKSARHRA